MECAFAGGISYALTAGAAGTFAAHSAATAGSAAAAGASLTAAGIGACAAALAPWAAAVAVPAAVAVGLQWAWCDAKDPAEEARLVMMKAQSAVHCTTLLGEGRFSKVYQVGANTGLVVKMTKADGSSLCETTALQQLQSVGGDVIIAFYGHCVINNETFIFLEQCSGSLNGKSFGETECACFVRQLFRALQHVHQMRFLHRDVKPANCLVKAWAGAVTSWKVRFADFGCSCGFSSATTVPPAGTLTFWAPELIAGEAPAASADIWAGAATAWVLATGACLRQLELFVV